MCARAVLLSTVALLALAAPRFVRAQSDFVRGDLNGDATIDISDPVASLVHLFVSASTPTCLDAGDTDDDGILGVTDSILLLDFLFRGGPAPAAPFPECGADPTDDDGLACAHHDPCPGEAFQDPVITEWTVPWSDTRPRDPYTDASGRVWFVGQRGDYVAYLEPDAGEFTRFDLPDDAGPHNVIVGERVWYTGNTDSHIGYLPADGGEATPIPMPETGARDPHTLVFDAAGDIWFTVQNGNYVGKLTVATEEVRLERVPTSRARPYGIVIDRDERPWFAEFGTNKLGVIDRETFEITEHEIPRSGARPRRIGTISDGTIWYVDYAEGYLGRFDPAGETFREWRLPGGSGARPYGMATDHRDLVWCVETGRWNVLVGFDPVAEEFVSEVEIPSGGGTVRHMHFDATTLSIWFGTDVGTIGRAALE